QDCTIAGEACMPDTDAWVCWPATGPGVHGEPCGGFCSAGTCLPPNAFTECDGDNGCCTIYCNHEDEGADAFCQSLDPLQTCEPYYLEGQAPDGYAHVGICTVPT